MTKFNGYTGCILKKCKYFKDLEILGKKIIFKIKLLDYFGLI